MMRIPSALLALGLAAVCAVGCGESSEPPPEISVDEISGGASDVFASADPEARQLAADVVSAIEQQDYTTAWNKLQDLNARADLTDAQRAFVAQSTASIASEVARAEAAGDEAARQAMEFHRANK